jgi:hypothetical protein
MRIKDIHKTLSKEVNLLKFLPKKEISVDSFYEGKKLLLDISKIKENKTIQIWKNKNIKLKKISNNKKPFDVLQKWIFRLNKINLNKKECQRNKVNNLKYKLNNIFLNKNIFSFFSKKIILLFLFMILIFINKIVVEHYTNSWYKKLVQLKSISNREELIKSANFDFVVSSIFFKPFSILPWKKINNANNVIFWGLKITNLLITLNEFEKAVTTLLNKKWSSNIMYSQLLLNNKNILKYSEKEIIKIKEVYNNIDFNENQNFQIKLDLFKTGLNEIEFYIHTINNNFETFLNILGHNKRKKYLIAFQNNDEIRPQWGFMWSLGILEIFRGQIKEFEKKDIYNYEFKIKKEKFKKELAPKWLNKLTTYLWLRDSNYFINHKDSWKKIKFFLEKAWYEIDWIIYLNQNSLFKILDLVWEFDSKVLNNKVNSKNFSLIMSSLVESKKSKIGTLWTPKQVLFDFMEELKQILNTKKINNIDIVKILLNDIKNREINFYNFNEVERNLLQQLWLFNPIKYNESLDFSYPVYTSISWNKSDRYIKTSYKKEVKKWDKCSYITSLEINLEHIFNKNKENKIKTIFDKFWIKKNTEKLLYIQWKWENKQYIRLIIPKNAIIKKPQLNIKVTPFYDKWKSIDFFLNTKPLEKSTFKIEYILPNSKCLTYSYKLYKQPGIREHNLKINRFWKEEEFNWVNRDIYVN